MGRKQRKKSKPKQKQQVQTKPVSTDEEISKAEISSEMIIRLKLTTRKGTRIESVPSRKLEKISKKHKLYWKLENDWLILYGI